MFLRAGISQPAFSSLLSWGVHVNPEVRLTNVKQKHVGNLTISRANFQYLKVYEFDRNSNTAIAHRFGAIFVQRSELVSLSENPNYLRDY